MTALEITLLVICYVLLSIASYPAFKRAEKNEFLDHPISASILAPIIWVIILVIAIIEGFEIIFKKN